MNIKISYRDEAGGIADAGAQPELADAAVAASQYMKALANPSRLMLLCELITDEKSVGQLEDSLEMSQAYVSQQLAKLRQEGLVQGRRDGRVVYYTICDEKVRPMIELLYDLFCSQEAPAKEN